MPRSWPPKRLRSSLSTLSHAHFLPLDTLDTLDILRMSSLSSTGLSGSGPWTSRTGHLSLSKCLSEEFLNHMNHL
jgi:hypothetical protein